MKKKKVYPRGKRDRKHSIRCEWCTEVVEVTREDAKTCSGRCRQRLAAFVRELGWEPDVAPGPMTASAAIDRELLRLVVEEQHRRAGRSSYIRATGTLPPRS
jgi:hypothetical protein